MPRIKSDVENSEESESSTTTKEVTLNDIFGQFAENLKNRILMMSKISWQQIKLI